MEGVKNNILAPKASNDFFVSSKNTDLKKVDEKVDRDFSSCFKEAKSIIENKNTTKKSSMTSDGNEEIDEETDKKFDNINILLAYISLFLEELEIKIDGHEFKKIDEKIIPILENISEEIIGEIIGKELFHYDFSNNNENIENILNQLSETTELLNMFKKDLDKTPLSITEKNAPIIKKIKENIALIKKEIELSSGEKTNFIENNVKNKVALDRKDFSKDMIFYDESKNKTEYVLKEEAEVKNSSNSDIKPKNADSDEIYMKSTFINSEKDLMFENKIESMENKPVEIPKEELIEQIVDKANIMLDEDSSEIRIKLKPEILGELLLKVEVEKGVVVAKAIVDNYRVKELIETNILQLKEGLEEQGLDIKTFQVQVGSNSDFDREQREEFFQNNRKNKRVKLKKESALNINNYEENIMSDNSISLNEGTLDLKA
ncbi:flagellar hook-length control protein FliK [Anaerosalibacter bizertensis]|uniref:Flagellar hook-length control protein FliK n=1 Tax=Anaerosalibacter bizertensis TaxID=932217 RepID=A0A9Q4AA56_9FIRM|nr:flagellar hook-length control protein FliK [Anaerosalibacter bizertensis]MBV1816550.1 flagellar hook-length control protein FliK [Bacteroidales bacterium MSK.15.36]MBU5293296.1 flagellar hook-length control protein FliK [Anaerosalibacter bizertensis]MCB5558646.1 flagellar hook-length control protein FliK [Anaerosalibacter bizertensis]MCG4563937.1 flagellar hook-length control protein FliK [Anaerosalibacter bizertensis]MCG4581938.1 flagellar hook-length control protein FliK [Anaerosalibacter